MRVSARQRLDMILDPENRQEIGAEIRPVDPLGFVDSKNILTALSRRCLPAEKPTL